MTLSSQLYLILLNIREDCVIEAFSHLNSGKSDRLRLVFNHVIYAFPALSSSLAKLFIAILRHGYVSEQLKNCVLVPIF